MGTYRTHSVSAGCLAERGGFGGVELGAGLLEAHLARRALHPVKVAARVHNHVELLRWRPQRERHQVLAVPRFHGALKFLVPV